MSADARERLKDQAVRDAIRRMASGEQPLTKAQLKAISRWPAEYAAEKATARTPQLASLCEGLQLLRNEPLAARAKRIVKKLLNIVAAEDESLGELVKGLKAEVKVARKTAQLIQKSQGSRPVTRKEAAAQLLKKVHAATEERRPADGVRGPGRPRNDDADPAARAAEKLTRKVREGAKKRRRRDGI